VRDTNQEEENAFIIDKVRLTVSFGIFQD